MGIFRNIISVISKYATGWLIPAVVAITIVIADYFVTNMSFPVFDSSESLNWAGYLFPERYRNNDKDAMYVNVGVDKELVPVTDEFGDTIGCKDVTDRKKLLKFLELASHSKYKYIFLDVRFEKGLDSESDYALFELIKSLPRFTFSTHRRDSEYEIADSSLLTKSAMSDYRGNMFTGFSRYEYLQEGSESTALRMYRELTGKTIEKNGIVYVSDGALAYNMQFIPLPVGLSLKYSDEGEVIYPYLGSQIMNMHSEEELLDMMNDKIIVIGDFDNDIHQSYVGDIPGPMIHYYAYLALMRGAHKVRLDYLIILFVIYFLIVRNLLGYRNVLHQFIHLNKITDYIRSKIPDKVISFMRISSPFTRFVISLMGFGFVLSVLKILLYHIWGFSFITVIPAVVFTVISQLNNILSKKGTHENMCPEL